jgi:hypothetical protein
MWYKKKERSDGLADSNTTKALPGKGRHVGTDKNSTILCRTFSIVPDLSKCPVNRPRLTPSGQQYARSSQSTQYLSIEHSDPPPVNMAEQLVLRGTLEGHSGWVTSLATSLEK